MALGFRVQWSTNWPLLLQTGLIPCPRIQSPMIYQLTFAAPDRAHTLTLGFRVQWSTNWPLLLQTGLIPCPRIQSPVIYQLTFAAPDRAHTTTLGFRVQWSTNWPLLLQTGLIPRPLDSESSDLPTDLCCSRQGSYPDPGIQSLMIYQLTFAAPDRAHTQTLAFRV